MWISKEKCERAHEYDVLSYLQIADTGTTRDRYIQKEICYDKWANIVEETRG